MEILLCIDKSTIFHKRLMTRKYDNTAGFKEFVKVFLQTSVNKSSGLLPSLGLFRLSLCRSNRLECHRKGSVEKITEQVYTNRFKG